MRTSNRCGLLALLPILATLLPSCVASASVERSLRQYEGQPLEVAVGRFGIPEKVIADGSGGKVTYWSWIHDSLTVLFHFQIDKNDRIVGAYWRFREEPAQMPQDQPGPK